MYGFGLSQDRRRHTFPSQLMWCDMADYRIFFLGPDGHMTGVEVVDCQSDLEAMAAAGVAGQPDSGVEVWLNDRMVGSIKAAGKTVAMHG